MVKMKGHRSSGHRTNPAIDDTLCNQFTLINCFVYRIDSNNKCPCLVLTRQLSIYPCMFLRKSSRYVHVVTCIECLPSPVRGGRLVQCHH